jgi:hypothetical protein
MRGGGKWRWRDVRGKPKQTPPRAPRAPIPATPSLALLPAPPNNPRSYPKYGTPFKKGSRYYYYFNRWGQGRRRRRAGAGVNFSPRGPKGPSGRMRASRPSAGARSIPDATNPANLTPP